MSVFWIYIFSHNSLWGFHPVFSYAFTLHPGKLWSIVLVFESLWKRWKNCFSCFCGVSQITKGKVPMHVRDKFHVCIWKKQQLSCPPSFVCGKNLRLLKTKKLLPLLCIPCMQDKLCNSQTNGDSQCNCYHFIILIKNSLLKRRP